IDQPVKGLDASPAQPRLIRPVCLGRVDHVIAVVEPMRDELFNECRWMLPVTVHEQHGPQAGMIEAGEQRRLLAEITRERDDLNIQIVGWKRTRGRERGIGAAVVHIDHLGGKVACCLECAGDLDNASVKRRETVCLVEQRHDDRKPRLRNGARARGGAVCGRAAECHRIWSHRARLLNSCPAAERYSPTMRRCRAGVRCAASASRSGRAKREEPWGSPRSSIVSNAASHRRGGTALLRSRRRVSRWLAWSIRSSIIASSLPVTTFSACRWSRPMCSPGSSLSLAL